jgi:cytochrome c556
VRALDAAVAAPPADCTALNALVRDLGDRCEGCHLEFR